MGSLEGAKVGLESLMVAVWWGEGGKALRVSRQCVPFKTIILSFGFSLKILGRFCSGLGFNFLR